MTCNILTTLLKPNFEAPLDSAKDLVDRNIQLFTWPNGGIWKQFLANSPIKEYQLLAERLYVTKNNSEYDYITEKYLIGEGTHSRFTAYINPKHLAYGKWYRSKELVKGRNPYVGYLCNKVYFNPL